MRVRDLRLPPIMGVAWAVALLCVIVPAATGWVFGVCLVGCAAAAAVGARAVGPSRSGLGLCVVASAVGAAVALAVAAALPSRDVAAQSAERVVELTAQVSSSGAIGADARLWFEALTSASGPPGRPTAVSAPVRIGVDPAEGFDLGASIHVVGEATATDAGERAALVVFASDAEVVTPVAGIFGVAAGMRQAFIERVLRLPEPGAGLLPGLAVGDTRAVSEQLTDDMRTSGLSHLTAVSGDIVSRGGGYSHAGKTRD